jgi:hypothetical protein
MLRHRQPLIIGLLIIALSLSACAKKANAPETIEKYLKAKVSGDEDKLVGLSCKAWEAQAALEAVPFQSVDAKIDNIGCQETGRNGKYTLVTCEGKLIINYRGEAPREQNLSGTTYRVLEENSEWKMCGTEN